MTLPTASEGCSNRRLLPLLRRAPDAVSAASGLSVNTRNFEVGARDPVPGHSCPVRASSVRPAVILTAVTVKRKKAELPEESIDAKVKRFTSVKDVVATIGLIALPAFSLRILSVSHYDLNTAFALLQNSPLVSFTYANVMTITPFLSYVAGVAILIHQQRRYPIHRRQARTWLAAASTYALSLLFFLPVAMMQTDFSSLFSFVLIFPLFFVYGLPSYIRSSLVVAL